MEVIRGLRPWSLPGRDKQTLRLDGLRRVIKVVGDETPAKSCDVACSDRFTITSGDINVRFLFSLTFSIRPFSVLFLLFLLLALGLFKCCCYYCCQCCCVIIIIIIIIILIFSISTSSSSFPGHFPTEASLKSA